MIIEPRIHITDAEMEAMRAKSMDFDLAIQILGRVQNAIRSNSFSVVEYVRDHVTDAECNLVDAGEIAVRLDDRQGDDSDTPRPDAPRPTPATPDITDLVGLLKQRGDVQVETGEGLRTAYGCIAEDGNRAIVVELDPLSKYDVESDRKMGTFEQLFWFKP